MKVVNLNQGKSPSRITVLSYGAMRSGKTRFAATWPRPLFLSDATESGWTTIANMDPNAFFEPGRAPLVWSIENAADMMEALHEAGEQIHKGSSDIRTIVVDSLTFYADLYFNHVVSEAQGRGDPRQYYQRLAQHLRALRIQVHSLPVNVVWLSLCKEPGDDNPIGGPMLSGQNAQKFAAGCDYLFYHRSYQKNANSPIVWETRTRRWANYQAGGRDEGKLPDPLGYVTDDEQGEDLFVPDCTYRTLAESLGIDAKKALAAPPPAKTPSAVAPPVASAANGKSAKKAPKLPKAPTSATKSA